MEAFQKIQLSFKCPKAFDELTPCNGGWYCDSCRKMVYDFRGMSGDEILTAFRNKGMSLCGMYDAKRIKTIQHKPKWYQLASAAMIVFGLSAYHDQEVLMLKPATLQQNQTVNTLSGDESFFGVALEINPQFPGGETAWAKYVNHHLNYKGPYKGRVFAQFVVQTDGSLTDIKIIRGGDQSLNEQIIKLIKNSPRWRPGLQNGKGMPVQFTLPFNFS